MSRRELAMVDTSDRQAANWLEPILKGSIPAARKAAAAAASANKIAIFGGQATNDDGETVVLGELVLMEVTGPNSIHITLDPPTSGVHGVPCARYGAIMQEFSYGKLFMHGGLDASNRPLNDGWLFDVPSCTWECVFLGSGEVVLPTGSLATIWRNRVVLVSTAPGSPKLDLVQSLDFLELRDTMAFTPKMRAATEVLLKTLEEWVDVQVGHTGLRGVLGACGSPSSPRRAACIHLSWGSCRSLAFKAWAAYCA